MSANVSFLQIGDTLPSKSYVIKDLCDVNDSNDYNDFDDAIYQLPDAKHTLIQPIPVRLNHVGGGEWIASFEEANIAMSGDNPEEAKESLAYDIMYAMELFYAEEEALSPNLKQELKVLRQYIQVSE